MEIYLITNKTTGNISRAEKGERMSGIDLGFIKSLPPWVLLGSGMAVGWLRSFWNFFYEHTINLVSKKVHVSLTIEEQDHQEAFKWINSWTEKHLRKRKIASLRLSRKEAEDSDTDYSVVPGYGFYYFWWKKKLVTFESSKKESTGSVYDKNKLIRTIELKLWGTRSRELLLDVVEEAMTEFEKDNPKQTLYYTHTSDYWDSHTLRVRPLDTLYLPEGQLASIVEDFTSFYASKEKYLRLGIPFRRGYLFYGPPGSGKTTTVQGLAGHFNVKIYIVNLSSGLSASNLTDLLVDCKGPCIVLMEDVDCVGAATAREETKEVKLGIQTNELLNILDGLVATEDRIVIMTTNHPEKLDRALVRAGRVDRRFHLGYAADPEIQRFHNNASKFYTLPEFPEFRRLLPGECTIADAQAKVFELNSVDKDPEMV